MTSLVGTFMSAWVRPWSALNEIKQQNASPTLKPYMMFVVVMGIVNGIIAAIVTSMQPAAALAPIPKVWAIVAVLVLVPVLAFVFSFIGAFFLWMFVDGAVTGTAENYRAMYRISALVSAFSPVTAIVGQIPKVGPWIAVAVNLWALVVTIQGVVIVRDARPVRAWAAFIGLIVVLLGLALLARLAEQPRTATPARYSDLDLGTDTTGSLPNDQLEKRLNDIAEQRQDGSAPEAPAPAAPKKK